MQRKSLLVLFVIFISFCALVLIAWGIFSFAPSFFESAKTTVSKATWQPFQNTNTSRIESLKIPFGRDSRKIKVYLPANYNTDTAKTYPTLYLLHGKGGDETDWLDQGDAQQTLDKAIRDKIIPPVIVLFPDGNGSKTHNTQYINAADGSEMNEDLISKDLVMLVDQTYRTKNDPKFRAIGGNSAGGFGALNIGLKHQDVFGQVMAFSGYGHLLTYSSPSLIQGSQDVIDKNSPLTYLNKMKNPTVAVWMMIGKRDSSAFIEDHIQLERAFARAGVHNEVALVDGAHDWKFWKEHLIDGLRWLGTEWNT